MKELQPTILFAEIKDVELQKIFSYSSFFPVPTCSQTYMPILLNLHVIVSAVRLYSLTKSFIYRIKRSS